MSGHHTLAAALIAAMFTAPAFATNGFTPANNQSGGAYHAMPGGNTRAEVQAQLAAARKNGSLAKMNSQAGYAPEFERRTGLSASRTAALMQQVQANDGRALSLEASAAGARTRAEVLLELQRARDDGSLRRMNTERGY